jgi:hypothetical protein
MNKDFYNKIKKKFPDFMLDYLPRSEIPRLRILFPDENIITIKEYKDYILQKILKDKELY